MRYLQCRMTVISHGRSYQDIMGNAEAVARCQYDVRGLMDAGKGK